MAEGSSSSAFEIEDWVGAQSGLAEVRSSCPHVDRLTSSTTNLPRFDSPCKICDDHQENWLCLSCQDVLCGRFINGHMLAHNEQSQHPLALSYRDLSVWCFACDSYVNAQLIPELRPAFDSVHLMKFGTPAPAQNQ